MLFALHRLHAVRDVSVTEREIFGQPSTLAVTAVVGIRYEETA